MTNDLVKFVKIESLFRLIHDGLSGLLKHVESLMKLCECCIQKSSIVESITSELKSSALRTFSYIAICLFKVFPRMWRSFEMLVLYGYKNTIIIFFLYRFSSKNIPWKSVVFNFLAGISSLTKRRVPLSWLLNFWFFSKNAADLRCSCSQSATDQVFQDNIFNFFYIFCVFLKYSTSLSRTGTCPHVLTRTHGHTHTRTHRHTYAPINKKKMIYLLKLKNVLMLTVHYRLLPLTRSKSELKDDMKYLQNVLQLLLQALVRKCLHFSQTVQSEKCFNYITILLYSSGYQKVWLLSSYAIWAETLYPFRSLVQTMQGSQWLFGWDSSPAKL